jgi:tetratricopeptide (TPR) repeat protein
VRRYPDYVAALHTLGLIYADKNNYERAFDCLARAAMLNPDSWATLTALSGVYLRLGANEMAAQVLERARQLQPRDASILVTLGEIYVEEREYQLAHEAYRQASAIEPDLLAATIGLGWALSYLGANAEAAKVFEGVVKRGVRLDEPVFALTTLPASVVDIDLQSALDRIVRDESQDPVEFENSAAFARAAAFTKSGRHAEAWQLAVTANQNFFATMQKELPPVIERQALSTKWVRENVPSVMRGAAFDKQPISLFILGPSRSGKTSMEKLVATLEGVKRGYENPIVETSIRRTFQTAGLLTSNHLESLPAQLHPQLRDRYLAQLATRAGSARVFTNTHPARIYDAARIAGVLPNVRFIFMKRDPDDTLLRIYMRKYQRGNPFAYDLKAARDHIAWYHETMDLLADKLPDIVRVIRYEDMVADPAAALRTAADLCGLPMQHGALPELGDDRGCAAPYRAVMSAELAKK